MSAQRSVRFRLFVRPTAPLGRTLLTRILDVNRPGMVTSRVADLTGAEADKIIANRNATRILLRRLTGPPSREKRIGSDQTFSSSRGATLASNTKAESPYLTQAAACLLNVCNRLRETGLGLLSREFSYCSQVAPKCSSARLNFCKSLSWKELVGAWRFEFQTFSVQGRRPPLIIVSPDNPLLSLLGALLPPKQVDRVSTKRRSTILFSLSRRMNLLFKNQNIMWGLHAG
jgi:hypothetical protein